MPKTIDKLITPDDKTIDAVFNKSTSYYIDIYQREYRWDNSKVQQLLNDIQIRFDIGLQKEIEPTRIKEDILSNFEPYFINSFLTNEIPGKKNIVDGQQRLTTFLIILIKLYQIADKEQKKDPGIKIYGAGYIEDRIYEKGPFGEKKFKIHNDNREKAFKAVLTETHDDFEHADETQFHIIDNYRHVNTYFEKLFYGNNDEFNSVKFNYYVTYLLNRISIVEIEITSSHNVAMIFEVVNDRGLGLQPFEILKGKLLGLLTEQQKEAANAAWTAILDKHYHAGSDVDDFFKLYFRAKFAKNMNEYERMEHEYHNEAYRNNSIRKFFSDFKNTQKVFDFVTKELPYFSNLYLELMSTKAYKYVVFNRMLDQKQQYLLIISAVKYNDSEKNEKITWVAKKFDQMHVLLRLKGQYESSSFIPFYVIDICTGIRDTTVQGIEAGFDTVVINKLEDIDVIRENSFTKIGDLFNTMTYQDLVHHNKNLSKYILLRVDDMLSRVMGKASLATDSNIDLEYLFNRTNRRSYELHLEHMYTHNAQNEQLFLDDNDEFDEIEFDRFRNQFGALLILKDSHNLSSGADIYRDKVETYRQSNIIWNEILVGSVADIDLRKLPTTVTSYTPNGNGLLDKAAVETRQKELFELIKFTWTIGLQS